MCPICGSPRHGATIDACLRRQTTCAVAGATNNPGPGSQTFYYTNQQSARLMFYHDHAWGITRLNVYVGEAAGYLFTDRSRGRPWSAAGPSMAEPSLPDTIPATQIPLIIQDKTFVNAATCHDHGSHLGLGIEPRETRDYRRR